MAKSTEINITTAEITLILSALRDYRDTAEGCDKVILESLVSKLILNYDRIHRGEL